MKSTVAVRHPSVLHERPTLGQMSRFGYCLRLRMVQAITEGRWRAQAPSGLKDAASPQSQQPPAALTYMMVSWPWWPCACLAKFWRHASCAHLS